MSEDPDWESTTTVLARRVPWLAWIYKIARDHLIPAVLGSAITAVGIAITYAASAQTAIHDAQRNISQLNETVAEQQKQLALLHEINTKLAVMGSQVASIASEVDRQREWRERIEDAAERPPHPRRRN